MTEPNPQVGHTSIEVEFDSATSEQITKAAEKEGISASDFILQAAREKAAEVFLDEVGHTC